MKLILFIFIIFFSLFFKVTYSDDLDRGIVALHEKDYKTALYYISYYAVLGDSKAQYNLGVMYNKGYGVNLDKKEAVGWFYLASDQGNMLAQYSLGLAYMNGDGVFKNYSTAIKFFKKSAFQGHPSSQINLGNMYFKGLGTNEDFPRAHMWYSIAQQKGLDGAYQNISILENLMNEKQISEAKLLFDSCQKVSLSNC